MKYNYFVKSGTKVDCTTIEELKDKAKYLEQIFDIKIKE